MSVSFGPAEQTLIDGTDTQYIGVAPCSTLTSEAKWQIREAVYVNGSLVSLKYANGVAEYNNKWDDRTTLTYK
jgi:hypothetical protein